MKKIEIMDTTLRDGEQTSGVSFSVSEKVSIARLLIEDLKIDRVEVASARVSAGERVAVEQMMSVGKRKGYIEKFEVLGFVDGGTSLKWIEQCGGKVINLLTKGSEKHCREQLRKTPEQHIADIKTEVAIADSMGVTVNIYLEDWSNGMVAGDEYVYNMVDALKETSIRRFMLPDTLGIFTPAQTYEYCRKMVDRYPGIHFDFHAHNDYDLSVGNVLSAINAGVKGVHTTVNGLGERAGNAPLSSVLAVIHDHTDATTSVDESRISHVSSVVESYSGIRIPSNKPVIGENVFTQCAGIHADGDNKNNLYYNNLLPERFGRIRSYALGKLSGKANILKNLELLGIELNDEEMTRVTQYIVELGDRKEIVTTEDLPYIISDLLGGDTAENRVKMLNYSLSLAQGLQPVARIKIDVNGKVFENSASGNGQYDAFMNVLRKIYKDELRRDLPTLTDYWVNIPPGGHTDAIVQTSITWNIGGESFKTRGLDADQNAAAIKATLKMLNKIES